MSSKTWDLWVWGVGATGATVVDGSAGCRVRRGGLELPLQHGGVAADAQRHLVRAVHRPGLVRDGHLHRVAQHLGLPAAVCGGGGGSDQFRPETKTQSLKKSTDPPPGMGQQPFDGTVRCRAKPLLWGTRGGPLVDLESRQGPALLTLF